jgi:core-2/I-Branching enzyme
MALAYLIRAHHRPEQLVRLVERLTSPTASFFVHVDGRAPDEVYSAMRTGLAGRDNVHWVRRVASRYAGFSLVRSVLLGLEEIERTGAPPHTVLLSGQCYPLRPAAEIERFLAGRPGESLVEHFRIPTERWADEDGGLRRIRYRHFERVRLRTRILRLPGLSRTFPADLEPWGGSAWAVLSDEAVRALLAFRDERPDAYRFFAHVKTPDEIYTQTVLLNSPLRDRVANETVHHIEWPGGSHPRTFTRQDFDRLAASGKPFARKFDVAKDAEILDVIDRELLGEG